MTAAVTITRTLGIDMGHCLPDHDGKCYRPHGHRYTIEATVSGQIQTAGAATGMIVDFGELKVVLGEIEAQFDHRFVMSRTDPRAKGMLAAFDGDGVIFLTSPPTAEYLAGLWASIVQEGLNQLGRPIMPRLVELTVWETPNCKATATWIP